MKRQEILLGDPFEERIGFARAVRVGPFIAVGGTAPIGEDGCGARKPHPPYPRGAPLTPKR